MPSTGAQIHAATVVIKRVNQSSAYYTYREEVEMRRALFDLRSEDPELYDTLHSPTPVVNGVRPWESTDGNWDFLVTFGFELIGRDRRSLDTKIIEHIAESGLHDDIKYAIGDIVTTLRRQGYPRCADTDIMDFGHLKAWALEWLEAHA